MADSTEKKDVICCVVVYFFVDLCRFTCAVIPFETKQHFDSLSILPHTTHFPIGKNLSSAAAKRVAWMACRLKLVFLGSLMDLTGFKLHFSEPFKE